MGSISLVTIATFFAVGSLFCLAWVMWNLIAFMRRKGLSGEPGEWTSQTREILLKPALLFFVIGGLSAAGFAVFLSAVSS